jgi:hypothetical protein
MELDDLLGLQPIAVPGPPDLKFKLDKKFVRQIQKQTLWCWAAATLSACIHAGVVAADKTQCSLARKLVEQCSSCPACGDSCCNGTADPKDAFAELHVGVTPNGKPNLADLAGAISGNKPVVCVMAGEEVNHAVVVFACSRKGSGEWVLVADPTNTANGDFPRWNGEHDLEFFRNQCLGSYFM